MISESLFALLLKPASSDLVTYDDSLFLGDTESEVGLGRLDCVKSCPGSAWLENLDREYLEELIPFEVSSFFLKFPVDANVVLSTSLFNVAEGRLERPKTVQGIYEQKAAYHQIEENTVLMLQIRRFYQITRAERIINDMIIDNIRKWTRKLHIFCYLY